MPLPDTKVYLSSAVSSSTEGFQLVPNASGDLSVNPAYATWVSGIADLNGDGLADVIVGGSGDDDKTTDAGRIYVRFGKSTGGTSSVLPDSLDGLVIDGVNAGDLAGAAVGSASDMNADGKAEILVGAPGMDNGALTDAGVAFVLWGKASGGIDLGDPYAGDGKGFAIKGEAAYDNAGDAITSISDLNSDGKADILVGATGNDAGGADAGAAYVVFGKSTSSAVNLSSVAAGTGGFKIVGENAGDHAGQSLSTVQDLNGDGMAEILVGAAGNDAGGADAGAAYVVFGKSTTTAVNLDNIALGTGGFKITGQTGDMAGSVVSGVGDVNADGVADILVGAPGANAAYVVFGKSTTTEVLLSNVASGLGGLMITGESWGDLDGMSITAGGDLNRDGVADIVIGAPHESEGGFNAGAVYIVWGGIVGPVDLALVAQGIGGAKIVGDSGSLTGSSVAVVGDMNGDTTPELLIGSPGSSAEAVNILYAPASWQPDHNIYGTDGDDVMTDGYGNGLNHIGGSGDKIFGLGGNDEIDGRGGDDEIDGGAGVDIMAGGTGNDTYYTDDESDSVVEIAGEGTDTVVTTVSRTLESNVENLMLAAGGLVGTGNALNNTITGTSWIDVIDGGLGADTMIGGAGNDIYYMDNAGDVIVEDAGAGYDSVYSALDGYTLGANLERLTLQGSARHGTGNSLNNLLTGTPSGDDYLDGGLGADRMIGGDGNDTYYVDNVGDVVIESVVAGNDTVISSVTFTLGADVENLTLVGAGNINGTGNILNNVLNGSAGNNVLNGGAGADTMAGGAGDDTYDVDNAGDVIVENAGEGNDSVFSSVDGYTLSADLESLTLTGTARHGTGNALNNTLTGTAGADVLDGDAGADTMIGGAGDDTYDVDDAGDVVVENAASGTDTVIARTNHTLSANVENLTLEAAAIGTGNSLDNIIKGSSFGDTLYGMDGNDEIDGRGGDDTMIGGAGDDVYYVDSIGDVIIENAGEGNDRVIVGFDYVLGDNIESAHITGAAHSLTGNSGNNTISGGTGDDYLDGGAGDDIQIGGAGNDTLVSSAGIDSLSGGEGDDTYVVKGGRVEIEDFLGHDTLDASQATGDSFIDLRGDDVSHIENEDCHLGHGGTTLVPLDVQFLQDLSGSFGDDITNVRFLIPQIVSALQAVQANSEFGSSTFIDKAVSPFGAPGEWVYETLSPLSSDAIALSIAYDSMSIHYGNDEPESQIEALMQLALHGAEVGFRTDSARFVVLFTDAPYHVAGDGAAGGITTPNNGDAIMDGVFPGTGEDYPNISQLKSALEGANIIPIFAIANNYEPFYQSLVGQLGRGTVVTLTSDSSNVVAAITAGMTAATTTTIEDAKGGAGNDTVKGSDVMNTLTGNDGDDMLEGRGGDDSLLGGNGTDTAVFAGAFAGYTVKTVAGVTTVTDINVIDGDDGDDSLTGVEVLKFADGTANMVSRTFNGTSGIDKLTALSNADWVMHGFESSDTLKGRNGNDTLYGDDGNDTLYGRLGNDTLVGGAGNDRLYGDDGNDQFLYSNAALVEGYDRVYGGAGYDKIVAGSNNTYIGLQEINGVEEISAGGFTGVRIRASSGDQTLDFSTTKLVGISLIDGGAGNDTLTGSVDADVIKGGNDNDAINGYGGADTLYGGTGADTFIFDLQSLAARDTIRDFSKAEGDVINLQNLLEGYDPLTSAITDFVRITDNGVNSYVAVDKNGALNGQSFVQIARVDGVTGLTDEAQMMLDGHLKVTTV